MNTLFIILQRLVPHHFFSRLVGFLAESKFVWLKNLVIRCFIGIYKVDMSESNRQKPEQFENFNDFFTRELAEGVRTIAGDITCPSDGMISALGKIEHNQIFQAKGLTYSLEKLLATSEVGGFINGSFVTIYLAPRDYHRVHFPLDASLVASRYVPGNLFSVNQVTADAIPDLFADNERLVCEVNTSGGATGIVMVGAMIVAGIKTVWKKEPYPARKPSSETFEPPIQFKKGDELGQFYLGSTVILLFPGEVDWQINIGDSVKFGDPLGRRP
jgi:phosphatidylserine decarboxylase